MFSLSRILAASVLALSVQVIHAADTDPAPATADKLAPARAQIAAKSWRGAIDELKRINDPASADWNNLMGYSLRKAKTPDYEAAEKFYDEALRIDPKHRGALEYSGELYLMKGDLAKAEERLGRLDKACRLPCDEYTDLKKAVQAYKDNGNKYVAQQ
ncbi:MAG TPA: tetratricopeptide repeat protein [Albitalea sp.]|uniref:tetratricopeptide repeat protein n=1 Tax=Piscinibacter sp. TaxID=1903157 RepID=UPI002ED4C447